MAETQNQKARGSRPAPFECVQRTRRSAGNVFSPPEVPASPAAARPGLPRPALPLMDLVLPGVLYAHELRGHWVPRSRHGLGFSPWPSRSLFVRRPLHLSMKFHSPASSPPPAESCGLHAALRAWLNLATQPNSRRAPPMGSSSLIATSAGGVHHSAGNPDPAVKVPSSTFLTSSTVSSATCLRGLVSSRCHVQGLPFRGLSLAAEPYRVSPAASCPLAVERSRL